MEAQGEIEVKPHALPPLPYPAKTIRKRNEALKDMFGNRDFDKDLEKFASYSKSKPRDPRVSYCTYFTTDKDSSYYTLAKLLVMSIIKVEPKLPDIHMVYGGDRPTCFDAFGDLVTLIPQAWYCRKGLFGDFNHTYVDGREITSRSDSNFCGKFQALLSCNSEYCCWFDADMVLVKPIVPLIKNNIFIKKTKEKKVVGGFYCLKEEWKPKFYAGMFEALTLAKKWGSDREMMRKVIDALEMPCDQLEDEESYWIHLTKNQVKKTPFRQKFRDYVLGEVLVLK